MPCFSGLHTARRFFLHLPQNSHMLRFIILIAVATLGACKTAYNPKHLFDPAQTPPPPDYRESKYWAALPDRTDLADRLPSPTDTDNQASAAVDVFFLHPTSLTEDLKGLDVWNGHLDNTAINKATDKGAIWFQASAFNAAGRVYAPRYRQAHLYSFRTPDKASGNRALDTAYTDVLAAFDHYMKYWNQGRPFILASHSQGARHTLQLIKDRIEGQPLQQQLVVAYILGWPVERGYLKQIPSCETPEQTGCYCSWRTYERDYGLKNATQPEVICTNPLLWNTQAGQYANQDLHRGAVLFGFKPTRPQICDAEVYKGILLLKKPKFKGSLLLTRKNYHAGDINLYYYNVRENAVLRTNTYLNQRQ
jgi:Protein of unknown function (DUF3089)